MGSGKRMQDDHEEAQRTAQDVLVRHEYVTVCEDHGEPYDNMMGDPREDQATLVKMISDMRAEGWSGDDAEAAELLGEGVSGLPEHCSMCERNMADD